MQPAAVREIELTDVALLLVSSRRGVAVLPDWVLDGDRASAELAVLPLGDPPVTRRLYAAVREKDRALPFMADMLRLARGVR